MTLTSAVLVILSALALFLYGQTGADRSRRALSRLIAYEYWATRSFEAVRDIVAIDDFPVAELDLIYQIVDRIDRPGVTRNLYAAFQGTDLPGRGSRLGGRVDPYFGDHRDAEAAYLEFFYSAMMAISYLDALGDSVRPKIEALNSRNRDRAIAMSDRLKSVDWQRPELAPT